MVRADARIVRRGVYASHARRRPPPSPAHILPRRHHEFRPHTGVGVEGVEIGGRVLLEIGVEAGSPLLQMPSGRLLPAATRPWQGRGERQAVRQVVR